MNVLVLFSGLNVLSKVLNYVERADYAHRFLVLTTVEFYGEIYRRASSMRLSSVEFAIIGERNVEEQVLKIYVDFEPDVVIDCDVEDRLNPVKRFFKNTIQVLTKCSDLDV